METYNTEENEEVVPYRKVIQEPYRAKNCYFFRDGDARFKSVKVCIHPKRYLRLEALLNELSTKVQLPFGVRSIFTPKGKDMITTLDSLEDESSYVCSQLRYQARGVDPNKVRPPRRWYYDKPSSGTKEFSHLLKEYKFQDSDNFRRKYVPRDERMANAYNRVHPKKITVLRNGDPTERHVVLINRRTAQVFDQILSDVSSMFRMSVSKLFTTEGRRISSLTSLINGPDVIVAAGKEPFRPLVDFVYEPSDRESRIRSRMGTHSRMSRMERSYPVDTSQDRLASLASRLRKRRDRVTRTRGHWKVWCATNELSTAGTTAQVTLTVYGHKGNSGPIPLGYPHDNTFKPRQVDEFEMNFGTDIGEIYKIRIAHDNSGSHPDWFCDEIRMQDKDTDENLVFPCRRWLSRSEDDQEICRELPAMRKGEPHLPVIHYEVTMVTGDLWNAGTQANVYLTIYGDRGDSGVRQLYAANKDQIFNKGQTNHFSVEAVSLGHLKRIIVGHDGTAPGDGWYLEKLSIQEPEAKPHEVYHFYCGRWLDEGEDDGKIVRELKVQDEYMEDILEKRNWEFEKWKFEGKNQIQLVSMLTGKALRIKPDGTVDGNGEDTEPGSTFIVSSKKPMIRVFTSLLNSNFHLAIDQGKVTGQGRGGPQCEFRIHVQLDRTVMLEGAKFPLQFITLQDNGKLGEARTTLDKDPAKKFHVYVRGTLRHKSIIMLKTSNTQAISVDHDKSVYATGRCNRASHFKVHKVEEGNVRMFESMIYPGFYLQLKDGKLDCHGNRNEESHFLIQKCKDKGYFTLQLHKQKGTYVGFTPRGNVKPTVDSGTNNICVFPEVIEYGVSKRQEFPDDKLAPISERSGYSESSRDKRKISKPEFEDGDYRVLVSTAEGLDQGQVSLLVFGVKGSTGPIVLAGPTDNGPLFRAGSTDEFRINLAKVGKLLKARLELAPIGHNREPSWKVQKVVLVDMNTQEKYNFNFDRWLSRERDDQDLMRELPAVRDGFEEESLPVVKYYVTVYTGKDPGSETDAHVYINIIGDFGDTGKRQLHNSNRSRPFQKGQSDTFELEAVHLGNVTKIQIGHDETKSGEGWFCDKVIVREGKTANMEFVFPCGRWFDSGKEDRKIERILLVQASGALQKEHGDVFVSITTHMDSGSPMQDTVLMYLYGIDGSVGPVSLGNGRDGHFKPGVTDEVIFTLDQAIGKLYKVRIGLVEEHPGYEWHLEKLKLKENNSGEEFDFDVGRWMSRKKEDCDVWRELPVSRFEESPLPVIVYTVEVHTSDISGADTAAAVYINLIGQRGDSGKRRLYVTQTEGKIFSQGKIDRFLLEAVSLGIVKSVLIGHSEKKPGEGWHLSYVAVRQYNFNDEQIETYFPCERWFDAGQDDRKTERELFPGVRPKAKDKSKGEFQMWVTTSEDSQPANGGKALLVVYGDKGHSSDIHLYALNSTAQLFEPANVDEFEISTGDIGEIYKIRITREDKETWQAWHLEAVKLEDKATGEVYTFVFDRWLSRDLEDGDLSRELPVVKAGKDPLTVKCYEVRVTTGNHWAAETDAHVYITLFGSKGDTGKRWLHTPKGGKRKFLRGAVDIFTIEAVDLKKFESIVIGHDGKGPGAGWFLEHIIVTEVGGVKQHKHMFPCQRWLDVGEDDGKTERILQIMDPLHLSGSYTVPSECGGDWKVTVKTANIPEAGTRAQVYITLYGTTSCSRSIPLGDGSPNSELFLPGKESAFTVTIGEIGELIKIRLKHNNENLDPGWKVDWVHMKHIKSGFDYLFTVNCWLAENKEYGQLFRERPLVFPGIMSTPVLQYIVMVQTGRKPNSGAHGSVCTINLKGSQGDTGQQLLSHPLISSADSMKDGKLDVYRMEAVCVGEIRRLKLGFIKVKSRAKRWFVESVKVMESLSALTESIFTVSRWLNDEDKEPVEIPLTDLEMATSLPGNVYTVLLGHQIPDSKGCWELWVWTGRQARAGTKDVITLILYGTTGQSSSIYLNKNSEFHTGSVVHIKIESGIIGDLFKIRLSFTERGRNASWYLDRMKLKNQDTKQEFNFEFNNWIHSTADNQGGVVELPTIRPDLVPLAESTYIVSVVTGDLPCAETSADVTLMLIGQWGDSGQRYLTKPKNNKKPFKRGQTDVFEINMLSLGKISKILLGHNDYGRGHGWFCQQVTVSCDGHHGDRTEVAFACNRWFDTGVDDRRTAREITALGTVSTKDMSSPAARSASKGIWICQIKTASMDKLLTNRMSHTEQSQVSLVVYGTKGVTSPFQLVEETSAGKFVPGHTYSFRELQIVNIGDLTKIRLTSGMEGDPTATWIIEEVLLIDETSKERLHFDFSRFVGEVGGDMRKEMPVIIPSSRVSPLITYVVKVQTCDEQNAGTTSRIFITLVGEKSDSGKHLLCVKEGIKPFQAGEVTEFEIETVELGSLQRLVITKERGDPWMLSQVGVKAGHFVPLENLFIWNNWIGSADKRDQEVEITLLLSSSTPNSVAVPTHEFPDMPVTRGHWHVEILTGTSGTKGNASDIIVVFCGSKGESSPVKLITKRNNPFQSGMTDIAELSLAEDVGDLIKIRLGFEDKFQHKSWHVQKITFEDIDTRDTFWFPLNDNVAVTDGSDGWKEFPVIWPGVFILPIIKYTITVKTGNQLEAGTKAQILVKLDGKMGSTGYRVLKDATSNKPKFQQGQTDTFVIEAVSSMTIDSVTIGHINSNPGAGWYLSRVTVRPNDEKDDYIFICNRWLDAGKVDGQTMITLTLNNVPGSQFSPSPPQTPVLEEIMQAKSAFPLGNKGQAPSPVSEHAFIYEVTTHTGKVSSLGTDTKIVLILYGDKGQSEPLIISKNSTQLLKEGDIWSFKISTDTVLGNMYKVRVGFDAAGKEMKWYSNLNSCPSWFMKMITLKNMKTGEKYETEAKQWIRMEDDHDYWREFPVKKKNPSETLAVQDYWVDVYTGPSGLLEANANVYIQLCGENGDTGWRHLHGSRTNVKMFEAQSHDLFRVEAVHLGKLSKVKVKHDNHGPGADWHLDKVLVKESVDSTRIFLFECNRWLDKGEVDSAFEKELPLTRIMMVEELVSASTQEDKKPAAGEWRVYTVTSSKPGSGTDANVTLTIIGNKGSSGPLPLGAKDEGYFDTGQTDQFDIWLEPDDIGDIKKVRLEHDNSGSTNGWRVETLVLENVSSGIKHTFDVNRWLSYNDKEGDIVYEGTMDSLKACKYVVKTVTEAEKDAGTDANVYINIIGSHGDSGKRCLKSNNDGNEKFAPGKTNCFLLEVVDLGDLEKIIIGHDGTKPTSSWKLQCVMIRKADSYSKDTAVFPCGKWHLPDNSEKEITIIML